MEYKNKSQLLDMTPTELQAYEALLVTEKINTETERGQLIDQDHDCKGAEDDACVGCNLVETKDDVLEFLDKQLDMVREITQGEEYHFAYEYALKNDCSVNEGHIKTTNSVSEEDYEEAKQGLLDAIDGVVTRHNNLYK